MLLSCFDIDAWTAAIGAVRRGLVSGTEAVFTRHGQRVARWPWTTILISLVLTGLAMLGFLKFEKKTKFTDLWLSPSSDSKLNGDWLDENYPSEIRAHSLIVTADNVLSPAVLKAMLKIHRQVENTTSSDGSTWLDHCKRVPVVRDLESLLAGNKRKKRQDDYYYDYNDYSSFGEDYDGDFFGLSSKDPTVWSSITTYPQPYCRVLDSFPSQCMEFSILELFAVDGNYDDEFINNLTQESIIDTINNVNESRIFFNERNFTKQLGNIQYDQQGRIVSAGATSIQYYTTMNATETKQHPVAELSKPTSTQAYEFEKALLETLLNKSSYTGDMHGSANVAHSEAYEVDEAIKGGIPLLCIGFGIMVLYVLVMLGDFNLVEHRVWLTVPAFLCVVMGIILCVGLGSAVGLPFTNFHMVLPLILLAIGIDDAFVLVSAVDNLTYDMKNFPLEEKFGIVMKNAGISVTITSLTNIVSFAAGGFTIIPGLSSFCIYCSIGIIAIYFHTVTFFLATLIIKQRHVDDYRDGCLPFLRHKNWKPKEATDSKWFSLSSLFKNYALILMKYPSKIIILVVTLCLLGVGAWAASKVHHKLDYTDLLNEGNYLDTWFELREQHFTSALDQAAIFVEDINEENFAQLHHLLQALKNEKEIVSDITFWTKDFIEYVNYIENRHELIPIVNMTAQYFQKKLAQFLFSPIGSQYRQHFTFAHGDTLSCGLPSPKVLLNTIPFTHSLMKKSSTYLPAMNKIKNLVKMANLTGHKFPITETYWQWELEETLAVEFPRNLSIGVSVIFLMTLCLLFDIKVSIIVLLCLIFSLVNTIGFGHLWGLTINLFTSCIIIISTGLYVDYSVHIAHAYLSQDSSSQKVMAAVSSMGPAVFNGGISTFLAISVLALSPNFTWRLFFKSFMMIVVFGLFHGLAFLPALLIWTETESQMEGEDKSLEDKKRQETIGKKGVTERFWNWSENKFLKKTIWFPISHNHILKANSVEDVRNYILQAKAEGKKVRVCGSQHSAKQAVFDYDRTGKEQVLAFTLDGDLRSIEHLGEGKFLVGGGCNLGIDPLNPNSNENNSLCQTMDRFGYALHQLGGMSHQTIAGFMSTGSSGGTLTFGMDDYLEAFDIITGNGDLITLQKNTDEFNAAAVSMGLFGVLVRVQVQGQKRYLVRGHEQTVHYDDSILKDGKSWIEASREYNYQANVWFPNHGVNTVLQRFGHQNPDYSTELVPYVHPVEQEDKKRTIQVALGLKMANKLDRSGTRKMVDPILSLLNPIDAEARLYNDHWWRSLPNDDLADISHLIRVQFTEIWVDVEDAEKVIKLMHEIFKDSANCGTFGVEFYTAKKSPCWMSMSFGHDVVRVDPYWFEHNRRGTLENFFGPFWEALLSGCPSARLHWGKHFPQLGSTFTGTDKEGNPFERTIGVDYCQKSYPKFQEWLRFREKFDPDNVFLTEYWKGILGLK